MEAVRSGSLEVRLAQSDAEIDAAQALRYRVFYEELGAIPSPEVARRKRDFDDFDTFCDHLLVTDQAAGDFAEHVVGTYRLTRRSVAERHGGFYSAGEYELDGLLDYPGEILELGRSCVAAPYRARSTMQLLWQGIAAYVFEHEIGLMFGCASLPGTDTDALSTALSYLYHNHLAPAELRPRAIDGRYVDMHRVAEGDIDARSAAKSLPPLIKGYLRLGGYVGDGAVIDHQFNTTDVCVVVRTDQVTEKYYRHYEREARAGRPV